MLPSGNCRKKIVSALDDQAITIIDVTDQAITIIDVTIYDWRVFLCPLVVAHVDLILARVGEYSTEQSTHRCASLCWTGYRYQALRDAIFVIRCRAACLLIDSQVRTSTSLSASSHGIYLHQFFWVLTYAVLFSCKSQGLPIIVPDVSITVAK